MFLLYLEIEVVASLALHCAFIKVGILTTSVTTKYLEVLARYLEVASS